MNMYKSYTKSYAHIICKSTHAHTQAHTWLHLRVLLWMDVGQCTTPPAALTDLSRAPVHPPGVKSSRIAVPPPYAIRTLGYRMSVEGESIFVLGGGVV